jgi:pyrroloquinoline-quinone synthase
MNNSTTDSLSHQEFKTKLMSLGKGYHIHHPFNKAMNNGELNQHQIRAWVTNRFYYQINIPRKDAFILANCPHKEIRQQWIQRIVDHDGRTSEEGGIEAWIRLGEACGINKNALLSLSGVLPGVRFAVDAYVNFVRHAPWQEAVCSSLTELFAPEAHQQRLHNWPKHYPWVEKSGFEYFQKRLKEAPRDVELGLAITLEHFQTPQEQQRALAILQFKLDVLWSILDSIYLATVLDVPISNQDNRP